MKTILRIIAILMVAAIVAGGFYLAVNNTSLSVGPTMEQGQPPAMTSTDGQTIQPMERPEGGEDGGSITRGLTGVSATLAKLTVITVVVLLLEKAFHLIGHRKFKFARH